MGSVQWGRDEGSVTLSAESFLGKAIAIGTCRGSHRTIRDRAKPRQSPYSSFTDGTEYVTRGGSTEIDKCPLVSFHLRLA